MANINFEKIIYNIIIIICFLFVANLFIYKVNEIYDPPGNSIALGENWYFSHKGETVYSGPTHKVILMKDRDLFPTGIYDMTTDFLMLDEFKDPVLVIPAMEGNGIRISINDTLLAIYGDMQRGRSSRWNTAHVIKIPSGVLIRGRNSLHIETLSLYKIGIHSTPFVVDSGKNRIKLFALQLFSNYSILLIIGNVSALGFILILLGSSFGKEGKSQIVLGIGLLFLSLYLFDYQYIELLPVDYVLFKKIIVSFSFISPAFIIAGINLYLNGKIDIPGIITIVLLLFGALYILTEPLDSIIHEIRYSRVNWFYSLTLFDCIWLYFTHWEKKNLMILLGGGTFTSVIMVHDIAAYHSMGHSVLFFHYGIIIWMVSISIVIVSDTVSFYSAFKEEKRKAELAHMKSMVDALTGAFNRRVIPKIDSQYCDHFSLILIDLDFFKQINDTYGHFYGDRVLRSIVTISQQIIREEDYCIRLGGDEFLLFLPHCRADGAVTLAEDLRCRINSLTIEAGSEEISFSCSMGVSEHEKEGLTEALIMTDKALYRAKKTRVAISL
jgi:diguanylate cyclase (GGDEF)-like protein